MNEKLSKKWILRGLKLRGLTQNQINTPYSMYENDRRKKLNALGDFDNKTPTHMDAIHTISNSERNFQIRIPRELDQTFYIPKISMIYSVSSNNRK